MGGILPFPVETSERNSRNSLATRVFHRIFNQCFRATFSCHATCLWFLVGRMALRRAPKTSSPYWKVALPVLERMMKMRMRKMKKRMMKMVWGPRKLHNSILLCYDFILFHGFMDQWIKELMLQMHVFDSGFTLLLHWTVVWETLSASLTIYGRWVHVQS